MEKVIVDKLRFNYTGMVTNENDFVGEFLGNNLGENESNPNRSLLDSTSNAIKLFTDESPHSTYDCNSNPNAKCGDRL